MPPNEIEGHSVTKLLKIAEKSVLKKTKDSTILDVAAEERIPKFDASELKLGKVLGKGGFCVVLEIINITLQKKEESKDKNDLDGYSEHNINVVQNRSFMEANCLRGKGKDCRYALKKLLPSNYSDATNFVNGIVDLAVEARFLAVVRHPNIIKMRAMGTGPLHSADFFVVLDRLYDIMGQRITKWKRKQPKGLGRLIMDRKGKKEMAFWLERITVAYDLACALKYLHESHIVYRDLKPDNIGFDVRDDVKIFDFGLAKEFVPKQKDADGFYLMTGDTGSPRYMAPEVALEKPYDERVDVYSFSILLWQMLRLETPFEGYTMGMFHNKVIKLGARPIPDPKWPVDIINILKRGWGEPGPRPSMSDVCEALREEINKNGDEEISEIMDASRKSAMSMHRL